MSFLRLKEIIICLLLLLGVLSSCHTPNDNKISDRLFAFKSEKPGMFIKLENSGNTESCFSLRLNENNFNTEQEILEKINAMPEEFSNEPVERKAWRFVSSIITRSRPITGERWPHTPLLMLNSIGFGQCDDFASVLSFIWKKQGFQSRVWGLEGHVVPEVFTNGKWQMYDPNLGIYYLNSKNEVAGVEELSSNAEYFNNPIVTDNIQLNDSLSFFLIMRYSGWLTKKYQSRNDNKVNEWYNVSAEMKNPELCLPPGATLEFPVDYPSKIYNKGFFGDKKELRSFLKITLPAEWKGQITLPFVIAFVQGKGEVELNNKPYSIDEDSLNLLLKKFMTFNNSLLFKRISEKVDIYCLLNPTIFKLSGNDSMMLRGTNLDYITATVLEGKAVDTTSVSTERERLISNLIQTHHKYYKKNQKKLDSLLFSPAIPISNKNDLVRNIKVYLTGMETMEPKERTHRTELLIKKIEKFYSLFPGNSGEKELAKYMSDPVTFIMFVSVLEVSNEEEMAKLLKGRVSGDI